VLAAELAKRRGLQFTSPGTVAHYLLAPV
jgi:hypothetical protein